MWELVDMCFSLSLGKLPMSDNVQASVPSYVYWYVIGYWQIITWMQWPTTPFVVFSATYNSELYSAIAFC